MGHLLDSEILFGTDLVEPLVRQLLDPDNGMLASAGIRTLDRNAVRFREGDYHNGQVWLWEQMKIAKGLDRYGLHGLGWQLKARLINVVRTLGTLPEYVRGGDKLEINQRVVEILTIGPDGQPKPNRIEQPPQDIQAWTVAAMRAIETQVALLASGNFPLQAVSEARRILEDQILRKLEKQDMLVPTSPKALLGRKLDSGSAD
jgi:glycogen debranching enzyme